MGTYVITPDAAIELAVAKQSIPETHSLLAPSVLRSHVLTRLYQAARSGAMTKPEADAHLAYIRGLRMRLLGDRVLQNTAWKIADKLGWEDTMDAEYVALTQLHGDALITLDRDLAAAVGGIVAVASLDALR